MSIHSVLLASLLLTGCKDAAPVKPQTVDKADIQWSPSVNGLRLGVSAGRGLVELSLENVGTQPLTVLSHVNAGDPDDALGDLDWFSLHLRDRRGATRELHMISARNESARIEVTLESGKSLQHTVDIQLWAARAINGNKPLDAGTYEVSASYEVELGVTGERLWSGKLEAGPTTMTVRR